MPLFAAGGLSLIDGGAEGAVEALLDARVELALDARVEQALDAPRDERLDDPLYCLRLPVAEETAPSPVVPAFLLRAWRPTSVVPLASSPAFLGVLAASALGLGDAFEAGMLPAPPDGPPREAGRELLPARGEGPFLAAKKSVSKWSGGSNTSGMLIAACGGPATPGALLLAAMGSSARPSRLPDLVSIGASSAPPRDPLARPTPSPDSAALISEALVPLLLSHDALCAAQKGLCSKYSNTAAQSGARGLTRRPI